MVQPPDVSASRGHPFVEFASIVSLPPLPVGQLRVAAVSCVRCHAFSADGGTWCAVSSAGEVLTGDTPDELNQKLRAHWLAMQ